MAARSSTKKKILRAAIDCFAAKNYKYCTMREIAERIDITATGIYRHFKSKQEILTDIFDYYKINFNKYRTPIGSVVKSVDEAPIGAVFKMLFFDFGTEEEREVMLKITRIIIDLKLENAEAKKIFISTFIDEPTEYLHTVFSRLISSGKIRPFNYKTWAFQMISFANMSLILALMNQVSQKELDRIYHEGIELLAKSFENEYMSGKI